MISKAKAEALVRGMVQRVVDALSETTQGTITSVANVERPQKRTNDGGWRIRVCVDCPGTEKLDGVVKVSEDGSIEKAPEWLFNDE